MHEAGLQRRADHDAEPDHVDAERRGSGGEQRDDDEGNLEEIEEERHHEDEDHGEGEEADLTARQRYEQAFDPVAAADSLEDEREDAAAQKDEDHHRGQAHGGDHAVPQHRPVQPAVERRKDQRADHAHGTGLGRRHEAKEDGAEDDEDQGEGRHHPEDELANQRPAADGASLRGQGGKLPGPDNREHQDPGGEQQDLHDRGTGGADIHGAGGLTELRGENNEHQRRRDQLRDGAGSGDDAGGVPDIVAVAHHDGQRDQAHRDDRSGNRAGDGTHDGTDEDHGVAQAAAHPPEELAEAFEQVFRQTALFEDDAHQREERHSQQKVVREHAIELVSEIAQKLGLDQVELQRGDAEEQPDGAQREGRRIADQHEHDEPAEHQRRHVGADEIDHCTGFS